MTKPRTKKCNDCGRVLPITDFHKIRKELEYRRPYCKPCSYQRIKAWTQRKIAEARAAAHEQGEE